MEEFEVYRQGILAKRLSSTILIMAIPFYLGFAILDRLFAPELWKEFLAIRIATACALLASAYALSKHKDYLSNHLTKIAHGLNFSVGLGIGYMTFKTGGFESPYYAGLNWMAIGTLAFWPCGIRDRLILVATIYGPLLLFESIAEPRQQGIVALLSIVFMSGTIALSFISNILSLRSLREEFRLRFELQELVRHKEQVISVKSTEAANLKRLAKQFSPAVIEAIETHAISLDHRLRQKVAIIFLDVAGSTARSTSIDSADYQKTLDLFFDMAIKVLLARNITVANFMGDGLMAIVNAPYAMQDFEKVAFEAAVEIINETDRRRDAFRELWRDTFQIRIGISSGFANVGFFPNSDFGVYTAIGESVNLASRLCSSTKSSTIGTTKAVLLNVGDTLQNCLVTRGGSIDEFKGFANHHLDYFIVAPALDLKSDKTKMECPLCRHELVQKANLGDSILLRCSSCSYTDIQMIAKEVKAIEPTRKAG